MREDTKLRLGTVARRLGPLAGVPLLLPVAVAAAPLWAVGRATRALAGWRPLEPPADPRNLLEYAPVLGVRPRAHLDTFGRGQDVFRLTTDAEGWRGRQPLDDAEVVAVGDSFAFGYGVDDDDHFAAVASRRVKAVASPAYSMVHAVLLLAMLGPRLRGKTVLWLVYCGNDLTDNLCPHLGTYRMPFVSERETGGWRITTDHVSPEPWTFGRSGRDNDRLYTELCTPSPYGDRVFGAADFLVGQAAATCEAAGATLAVASVPITTQVTRPAVLQALSVDPGRLDGETPDRRLGESCRTRAVPFVALSEQLRPRHYWQEDMHWNGAGHRLMARVLDETVP